MVNAVDPGCKTKRTMKKVIQVGYGWAGLECEGGDEIECGMPGEGEGVAVGTYPSATVLGRVDRFGRENKVTVLGGGKKLLADVTVFSTRANSGGERTLSRGWRGQSRSHPFTLEKEAKAGQICTRSCLFIVVCLNPKNRTPELVISVGYLLAGQSRRQRKAGGMQRVGEKSDRSSDQTERKKRRG